VPTSNDFVPPGGQTLQEAFEALVSTFNERGVRYAIIGGLATIQHTRVRTTDDIDALLTVPQLELPALFEALRQRGFAIDLKKNIRELRDGGMTSIQFADVLVDLIQPMIPPYAHVLDRAISTDVLGHRVRVSSAECLVVMKLMAMRPQDEADVRDILAAYAGKLDLDFIQAELESFTKPDDPRRAQLARWVRETTAQDG
jgi:predicted nucleotidyltransferase